MENKQEILMQPNNLIKSKYDFTTVENRLFYKILYNAQKQHANNSLYKTVIKAEELKEFLKKPADYVSTNIEEKLTMFKQSILSFDYIDETTGNLTTFSSGLVTSHYYDHNEQIYTIEIHRELYRHITDFVKMQKEGYSPLNLSILFNFKGAYTQRIYTLLRMWSRQNREIDIKFSLETLRSYLKCETLYPAYADFKRRVLVPAIKEINKVGNMEIIFDKTCEIKRGRSVREVSFKVTDLETRKYFDEPLKIEAPEENKASQTKAYNEFKAFMLDMTSMHETVFPLFFKDYGGMMEQFMEYDSTYLGIFLKLQAKVLQKDNTDVLTIKQYLYIQNALMQDIVQKDLEDYHETESNKEYPIDLIPNTPAVEPVAPVNPRKLNNPTGSSILDMINNLEDENDFASDIDFEMVEENDDYCLNDIDIFGRN